jgi:hypothetical protein
LEFFWYIFAVGCKQHIVNNASKPYDTLNIDGKVYSLDSISVNDYKSVHYEFPGANDTIPLDTTKIKIDSGGIIFYTSDNGKV